MRRIFPNRIALVLCGLLIAETTNSLADGLFEFVDDFGKPACCQRDGWEERLETERHDFTQSATTVGRGILQIESGYSYFYKDAEEIESSHTFPETLLRFGLSEDIELRLRWNYAWQFIQDEPDDIGAEDLRYSLKFQLTRGEDGELMPTSALEVRGSTPTGGAAFSSGQTGWGLDYIYQWQLSESTTLAGSTGFGTNGFGDFGLVRPSADGFNNFDAYTQSVALGIEVSEVNTIYTEWFGIFSDGLDEEFSVSTVNVGIDHYFTDDLVVDLRVGVGLTEDSDDFFTGVGGGFRF